MDNSQDRVLLGIILISASVAAMAFGDAIGKTVSENLTIWQIFFCRSAFAIPIILGLFKLLKQKMRFHAPFWIMVRSFCLVATWLFYYSAFPVLSLSVAAVGLYTFPIFTCLMSAYFTGEPVTARQWAGVFLGFAGVVVILQPGSDAFSWFTALPLCAAFFLASAMILTRTKCQKDSPLVLAFSIHIAFFVTSIIGIVVLTLITIPQKSRDSYAFLFEAWLPMNGQEWALMLLLAVLTTAIFMGIARAYQIAPAPIIATFDYVYLISAAIWSFVFFAEKPGAVTLIGMALIIAAGILVALPSRKSKLARA